MARVLDSLPGPTLPGAKLKYPWDDWLDGRAWEIMRGEDFTITARNMSSIIRMAAVRKGLHIKIILDGNRISFQVIGPDGRPRPVGV